MANTVRWLITGMCLILVAGCATQARYYSSVVDYVYPNKTNPVEKPAIPVMNIPINVGVAFVPDQGSNRQRNFWQNLLPGKSRKPTGLVLSEKHKTELMQKVSSYFKKYPYIKSIEVIPSAYLTTGGSFSNLDQIKTMYGIDAIALLSYDQIQFTDEGAASFLYWTIIGAYIIPGEKNTTQTMMDAVVYDIKSRKMLFRAPGVSQVKGNATPVNLSEELRKDSEEGFKTAAVDLIDNLDSQLTLFKEKIKERPEEYKIVQSKEYASRGGGNLGGIFTFLLALFVGIAWRQQRRK